MEMDLHKTSCWSLENFLSEFPNVTFKSHLRENDGKSHSLFIFSEELYLAVWMWMPPRLQSNNLSVS